VVKERPILFSAPMVRAILEGRKTQTRRIVKTQPPEWATCAELHMDGWFFHDGPEDREDLLFFPDYESSGLQCPYGKPGDRLWVRETFYYDLQDGPEGPELSRDDLYFRADGECCEQIPECSCKEIGKPRWHPSIHMPRWASRITLEITGVRVERIQSTAGIDALAEGIESVYGKGADCSDFAHLWEQINGPGSWASNPWVWVIEFKRVEA
jgi:hypothetical protein